MSREHLDRLIEAAKSADAPAGDHDSERVLDVGMSDPEMQALLRPTGTYRKSKRQIERENRQARYEWARNELVRKGKDPTDAAIGEKLKLSVADPGRTVRRWREAGDIP